ncbi:hypothetical protein [uncultured Tolumonas sp.]|uniref:hypothetical protein n=1 Tax=uncultured Tolumonas sp. TaxID=263765 RepID=UPI002A0A5D1D|nr:hypothetical protein [uncultured Tolumonas sp.]
MKNWLRTLLFISAFSPAFLSLAYVRYDLHGLTTDVIQLIFIGLVGLSFPVLILKLVKRHGESFIIQIKKIESNDFMLLGFIFSYISPFILRGADISLNTIMFIVLVLCIILWTINTLPSHPLLRFLKFRFYKVESSSGVVYILIARREILDPKQIKSVRKISSAMLIEE